MSGMVKRSAAMSQACLVAAYNMPAPVFDGLGHATRESRIDRALGSPPAQATSR